MRKILSLFAVGILFLLVAPCSASSPPAVTNGLVGCWEFDEGSGFTASDISGFGNNGSIVNATYSADAPPQARSTFSLKFNSTSGNAYSYVTIPDSPSLRPSSGLTLSAWVKTDTVEQRSCIIVSKQYGSSYHDSFALVYSGSNVNFQLEAGGGSYYGIGTAKPTSGGWHHIVGTYNGSVMRLFVDGVERSHSSFSGSIVYDSNPVLIGAGCDNGNHIPDAGWNGNIGEVLIYNRAMSEAEIAQIIPEFQSVPLFLLFVVATTIAATVLARRSRKRANLSFS
jgi:hypothetical protein